MNDPMQMIQQLMQFKNSIREDPRKMVEQLIASGRISQQQLNQYQNEANRIMTVLRQMNIRI